MPAISKAKATTISDPKAVKTSVYLPKESVLALKKIARKRGTTMAGVLRAAIKTERFLDEATASGAEILIRDEDGMSKLVRM